MGRFVYSFITQLSDTNACYIVTMAFARPYFLLNDNISSSENLAPLNAFSVAFKNSNGIRMLF